MNICASVHLCGDMHRGISLFPELFVPPLFLFQSHTDAVSSSLTQCLFPLSLSCSLSVQHCTFCRPSPLFFSVCYLQPSCHISPLPATFLVISEGVTYLSPERQLLAKRLAFLDVRTAGRRSVQTGGRAGIKQGGKFVPLSMLAPAVAGTQTPHYNSGSQPFKLLKPYVASPYTLSLHYLNNF